MSFPASAMPAAHREAPKGDNRGNGHEARNGNGARNGSGHNYTAQEALSYPPPYKSSSLV